MARVKKKRAVTLGQQVGKLTVINLSEPVLSDTHPSEQRYDVECTCGTIRSVQAHLLWKNKWGHSRKWYCGDPACKGRSSENLFGSTEYMMWHRIWESCTNPSFKLYDKVGAYGIKVCDRWCEYKNFIADMGNRPGPNQWINRIDRSKDFSPENCCWFEKKDMRATRRTSLNTALLQKALAVAVGGLQ